MDIPRFDVYVAHDGIDLGDPMAVEKCLADGDYDRHRVTVLHPDQLLAEQAGPRYGLGTDLTGRPIDYTTLWCWAALTRTHVAVPEYPLWKQRVLSIDKVRDEEGADAVDPTGPGVGTGSPSPSGPATSGLP